MSDGVFSEEAIKAATLSPDTILGVPDGSGGIAFVRLSEVGPLRAEVARLREELAAAKDVGRFAQEACRSNAKALEEARGLLRECYGAVDPDLRAAINRHLAPPAATPPPAEPRRSHGPAASDVPGAIGALAVLEAGAPRNPEKP